jgi:hypothetical protein
MRSIAPDSDYETLVTQLLLNTESDFPKELFKKKPHKNQLKNNFSIQITDTSIFIPWGLLFRFDFWCFNATFSNIMVTSFSGGRSRSTRRESPTMCK